MYHRLLNGLFAKINTSNSQERVDYLRGLQQPVLSIRNAYGNLPVKFDYSDHRVQAAYLLAYVPHYTDVLWRILSTTEGEFLREEIDELVCIGSGPCPEIIALLKYFNEYAPNKARTIKVFMHDIAIKSWEWSREIVFEKLVPMYPMFAVEICNEEEIDISKANGLDLGENKKIVVIQNCMCEVNIQDHSTVETNIINLARDLPEGSYLALIDISFPEVKDLIHRTQDSLAADHNFKIVRDIDLGPMQCHSSYADIPQILREHLLVGADGLIPRRNVNFIYSLLKKESSQLPSFPDVPF